MPRVAFCNVGGDGARCLCHLVVLSPARVVGVVEVAAAEVLRGQLYHVGKHPCIQPVISESVDLHLVSLFCLAKIQFFRSMFLQVFNVLYHEKIV